MKVEGLSNEEMSVILYDVGRAIALKYKFGYHSVDDMVHQGIEEILLCLQQEKFKPRGDKPVAQQFKNWVRVWMRNKLSNYRRKYSCRYANADSALNQSKFKIMHPLKIHSQGLTQSEIFARSFSCEEHLQQQEALQKITSQLEPEALANFIILLQGGDLPADTSEALFILVKDILNEEA